jgi:hypothetical protein
MINTLTERTFPLAQAARRFVSPRGQKCLHPSTAHRWRYPGIAGVRLECLKVGGVWHTSEAALQRFFERLTAAQAAPPPEDSARREDNPAGVENPAAHHRLIEAQLDAALNRKPPPIRGERP